MNKIILRNLNNRSSDNKYKGWSDHVIKTIGIKWQFSIFFFFFRALTIFKFNRLIKIKWFRLKIMRRKLYFCLLGGKKNQTKPNSALVSSVCVFKLGVLTVRKFKFTSLSLSLRVQTGNSEFSKSKQTKRNEIRNPITKEAMVLARLRDRKTPRKREIRPSLSRQRSQGELKSTNVCLFFAFDFIS